MQLIKSILMHFKLQLLSEKATLKIEDWVCLFWGAHGAGDLTPLRAETHGQAPRTWIKESGGSLIFSSFFFCFVPPSPLTLLCSYSLQFTLGVIFSFSTIRLWMTFSVKKINFPDPAAHCSPLWYLWLFLWRCSTVCTTMLRFLYHSLFKYKKN